MIINDDLLFTYGATVDDYKINQTIFYEGTMAKFYFQIVSGTVSLNNYHEDGKEFIQNIISDGQSFGESLLFTELPYPMSAIVRTNCTIIKLPKKNLNDLLSQNLEANFNLIKCLSDRLYYKYKMQLGISSSSPLFKLQTLLDYFKDFHRNAAPFSYLVPHTRQQLANLTGMRVETVIRTVKKMEKDGTVKLIGGKIYY
jgi:CRP-like cAMP-binding protein